MNNQRLLEIIKEHTDAFLIQMLGINGAGLPPERVQYLRERGVLRDSDYFLPGGMDPLSFVQQMGAHLAERLPTDPAYRDTLDKVEEEMRRTYTAPTPPPPVEGTTDDLATQAVGQEELRTMGRMPDPGEPAPTGGGIPGSPLSGFDWSQEAVAVGSFIRGLGNAWSDTLKEAIGEEWDGETAVAVPDPDRRQKMVEEIRRVVAEAKEKGITVQQVASRLASATKDFTRDWRRIAETEMQGLYNQSVAREAVTRYGKRGSVIRLPEKNACAACLRVFTRGGEPITWSVDELVQNGTNVGLPRSQWKATLWPVHPKCRCGTLLVSPFMEYRDGRLRVKRST